MLKVNLDPIFWLMSFVVPFHIGLSIFATDFGPFKNYQFSVVVINGTSRVALVVIGAVRID